MYPRTVKVRSSNGTVNEYVRVVEAYREGGKVKQRVVADLGRKDLLIEILPKLRKLLGGDAEIGATIEVLGRAQHWPRATSGMLRAHFASLCVQALGPADYIAIAGRFHTIFLEALPRLAPEQRNEARRLAILVDTLYEARARLVVFTVSGASKQQAFAGVVAGDDGLPATRVDAERIMWLVDRDAAGDTALPA